MVEATSKPINEDPLGSEASISMASETSVRPAGQTNLDDYELGRIVGEGAYGQVILSKEKATGKAVAIKTVSQQQIMNLGKQKHVYRERDLLRMMDHPFIIKLYGTTIDEKSLYFVF